MQRNPEARPTITSARRIAVALQEPVKAKLDEIERDGVIAKITEPSLWSSYMVVVVKNGKMRICLDPSESNKAIFREHYHMPTLEDVLPRLHGASYFSTLDASSGFWQVYLDEESSSLCTISAHYGRHKFLRMPFGIASAPDIFQRAMHEVVDGLTGVSVVMDDLLV